MGLTKPQDIIAAVYRGSWDRSALAALAPIVLEVAADGDEIADCIVDRQAGELAACDRRGGQDTCPAIISVGIGGRRIAWQRILSPEVDQNSESSQHQSRQCATCSGTRMGGRPHRPRSMPGRYDAMSAESDPTYRERNLLRPRMNPIHCPELTPPIRIRREQLSPVFKF